MHPYLNFLDYKISAYLFFMLTAFLVVMLGSFVYARKRGFSLNDCLWMILGMGVSVFVGARLFNVAVNYPVYLEEPMHIFSLSATGFSLYGGIFMAILVGLLISRVRKIALFKFADTVTPFVGIGIALMRVGCFLNGCCFGKTTDLPWGVTFPQLSQPHIHQLNENLLGSLTVLSVHPTQIYEFVVALILSVVAFVIIRNRRPDGTAFLVAGALFSVFRWLNMSFREIDYPWTTRLVFYPGFYLGVILLCLILLVKINIKFTHVGK